MIRKTAAIATIVVLIFVIAISITKANPHVSLHHVLDQQHVELGVLDVDKAGDVDFVNVVAGVHVREHVGSPDAEVTPVFDVVSHLVAVREVSRVDVDASAVVDVLGEHFTNV
ncbi:MAG TPA: hypothetical protein VF588_19280 [Pyrinomonadaceae bacterium]|jgi:hypothetical protein